MYRQVKYNEWSTRAVSLHVIGRLQISHKTFENNSARMSLLKYTEGVLPYSQRIRFLFCSHSVRHRIPSGCKGCSHQHPAPVDIAPCDLSRTRGFRFARGAITEGFTVLTTVVQISINLAKNPIEQTTQTC